MAALDRFLRRITGHEVSDRSASESPTTPGVADDWREGLPDAVAALIRPCYLPEIAAGRFENHSGFGGAPYLPRGVEHPACPRCWVPMPLLVQLRLDELPNRAVAGASWLLQLFYCTTDAPDLCERPVSSWAPTGDGVSLRIVPAEGGMVSSVTPRFPALTITGWREEPDLPNWEELRGQGIVLEEQLALRLINADMPRVGDKLAGWPAWVQGVEYPACPVCGSTMRLFFQLDSEDHVAFKFGDSATGHITQCERHRNLVAFRWACY